MELVPYLMVSFGHPSRIDYGTGHETSFVVWLCESSVRGTRLHITAPLTPSRSREVTKPKELCLLVGRKSLPCRNRGPSPDERFKGHMCVSSGRANLF